MAALTDKQLVARAIEETNLLVGYLKTIAHDKSTQSSTVAFSGPIIGYRVLGGKPIYRVFSQVSVVNDGSGGVLIMATRHEQESLQTYALSGSESATHPDAVLIDFKMIGNLSSIHSLISLWKQSILGSHAPNVRHATCRDRATMPALGGTVDMGGYS